MVMHRLMFTCLVVMYRQIPDTCYFLAPRCTVVHQTIRNPNTSVGKFFLYCHQATTLFPPGIRLVVKAVNPPATRLLERGQLEQQEGIWSIGSRYHVVSVSAMPSDYSSETTARSYRLPAYNMSRINLVCALVRIVLRCVCAIPPSSTTGKRTGGTITHPFYQNVRQAFGSLTPTRLKPKRTKNRLHLALAILQTYTTQQCQPTTQQVIPFLRHTEASDSSDSTTHTATTEDRERAIPHALVHSRDGVIQAPHLPSNCGIHFYRGMSDLGSVAHKNEAHQCERCDGEPCPPATRNNLPGIYHYTIADQGCGTGPAFTPT